MNREPRKLYRVKFSERDTKEAREVVVESVTPSDFLGLVVLEGFVFEDNKKAVILPSEDEARKRFGQTDRLHIPYHNLIYVEEFTKAPTDLKSLPFIKEVTPGPDARN